VIEEVEVGGVLMRPGDAVVLALSGANHDERVFADAATFCPDRGNARSHLAFGQGTHYCPGAPLARLELTLALPMLFERFPGLALAVPVEELTFQNHTLVYGVDSLPVTW
jgi:cytochrome P450